MSHHASTSRPGILLLWLLSSTLFMGMPLSGRAQSAVFEDNILTLLELLIGNDSYRVNLELVPESDPIDYGGVVGAMTDVRIRSATAGVGRHSWFRADSTEVL